MAIRELNTRITLKYDSYYNWTNTPGKNIILLKGEVGICEIPSINNDSTTAPTAIFKVGTGAKYPDGHEKAGEYVTFEDLPWASARAADVYSWAKASAVEIIDKKLVFVGGNPDGTDKEIIFDYVTIDELESITADLASRIAVLESALEDESGIELNKSIIESIVDLKDRLDTIEGEDDGSIKKAMADTLTSAQTYTNTAVASAEESANEYTDAAIAEVASTFSATESALEELISGNTAAISNIDKKLGGEYSESNTVYDAITDAKAAGTTAQVQVEALAEEIEANTVDIASNASDIAANTADIEALESRVEKVEAFFGQEVDREDGSYEHLNKALDTLVEIQEYLTGDGESAGDLINRVTQNESDIADLQSILAEGGDFEKRVAENEASISNLNDRADSLASIVKGYTTEGSIKTAIEVVDSKASDAQTKANNLVTIVGNENSGLVQLVNLVKETADGAVVDIAALGARLDTAESTISSIQDIITGTDSNVTLREDITDLQGIVKTGPNANATLRADLTAIQDLINNEDDGLAKVKEIADGAASLASDNASRLAVIEEDYLREVDKYLFSCGTASTITFSN